MCPSRSTANGIRPIRRPSSNGSAARDAGGKKVALFPKDLSRIQRLAHRELDRQAELTRATGLAPEDRQALEPLAPERAPKKARKVTRDMLGEIRDHLGTLLKPPQREPERSAQRAPDPPVQFRAVRAPERQRSRTGGGRGR